MPADEMPECQSESTTTPTVQAGAVGLNSDVRKSTRKSTTTSNTINACFCRVSLNNDCKSTHGFEAGASKVCQTTPNRVGRYEADPFQAAGFTFDTCEVMGPECETGRKAEEMRKMIFYCKTSHFSQKRMKRMKPKFRFMSTFHA